MRGLFWSSLLFVCFTYVGYPILLYLGARFWPRPIKRARFTPRVTVLLAVCNEEKYLLRKLQNLAEIDYPPEHLDVIAISDGSEDDTNRILTDWRGPNRRTVILPERQGKASALNSGLASARGEIIVFTDARQIIAPKALKNLIENFADPSVGCASGELTLCGDANAPSSHGISLYWQLERSVRNWEGLTGSTVGATGAFYAARRDLVVPLPSGTILDDMYIPIQIARQGRRVVFDPSAVIWDDFNPNPKQEFHRKVRTLTGNYQLFQMAPWLLASSNPLRMKVLCHKLLRLMVPFFLIGILISTFWLRHSAYGFVFGLQVAFYMLATLALLRARLGRLSQLANVSFTFVMLNTAAAVAFIHFLRGTKAAWTR